MQLTDNWDVLEATQTCHWNVFLIERLLRGHLSGIFTCPLNLFKTFYIKENFEVAYLNGIWLPSAVPFFNCCSQDQSRLHLCSPSFDYGNHRGGTDATEVIRAWLKQPFSLQCTETSCSKYRETSCSKYRHYAQMQEYARRQEHSYRQQKHSYVQQFRT